MNAKDLLLKALGFTGVNIDHEVTGAMLDIREPTDEQVEELIDQFDKLYRQIDEGEFVLVPTKPRSERNG